MGNELGVLPGKLLGHFHKPFGLVNTGQQYSRRKALRATLKQPSFAPNGCPAIAGV
jgi:hypothetical protein